MYHVSMAQHEDDLFELLQPKLAEEVPNNEDDSTVGTIGLYDEPEDREPSGQTNSSWGERGPTQDGQPQADVYTDGAWEGAKETRQGVVDNALSNRAKADKADQKLIGQNFRHGKSGDFTTHSMHLQGKSVEKISHATPTLMERVVKVAGRL